MLIKGVNGGVVSSPFVVAEALDKRCCLADWTHDVFVGAEQRDHFHTVTILLVSERHQDKAGVIRGAVVMCDEGIVEKESDVSNADEFGAAVLFGVLTQPHRKEERKDHQLCNR